MSMPLGYVRYGQYIQPGAHSVSKGQYVCKLLKSLYGLKQAPRQWFEKLSNALLLFGFHQPKANYTFSPRTHQSYTVGLIYMHDMIITGNVTVEISNLKAYLSSHFHMKDFRELSYF